MIQEPYKLKGMKRKILKKLRDRLSGLRKLAKNAEDLGCYGARDMWESVASGVKQSIEIVEEA